MTSNIHNLKSKPREVLVLCYPNSGSSLISGILHHLGINMGDNLKQAQRINPKGLYEDEDFSNALGKIWFKYNISPGYNRFIDLKKLLSITRKDKGALLDIISKKHQKGRSWGIKEPRLSLLWPALTEYLENPHWIIASRDSEKLVKSRHSKINKRVSRHRFENIAYYIKQKHYFTILSYLTNSLRHWGISEKELKEIITHYYALLYNFVENKKHLTVQYEKLLNNPADEIKRIASFLSLQPDNKQCEAAMEFISPTLRHF